MEFDGEFLQWELAQLNSCPEPLLAVHAQTRVYTVLTTHFVTVRALSKQGAKALPCGGESIQPLHR